MERYFYSIRHFGALSCIVFGEVLPWTNPWLKTKGGKPVGEERCPGVYKYSVHVADCGNRSGEGSPGWDGRVGFIAGEGEHVQAFDLGSDLWVKEASCYESGWTCGCDGALDDSGTTVKLTVKGGFDLNLSVDTATWTITGVIVPPAGARAMHSDSPTPLPSLQPVPQHHMAAVGLVPGEPTADAIRPSFILNAGATLIANEATVTTARAEQDGKTGAAMKRPASRDQIVF